MMIDFLHLSESLLLQRQSQHLLFQQLALACLYSGVAKGVALSSSLASMVDSANHTRSICVAVSTARISASSKAKSESLRNMR